MKRVIVLIVILSVLYFLIGIIAVQLKWLDKELYLTLSAIIGGLASVSGLLSFGFKRNISNEDIENIEINYFKKVVDTSEKLKLRETELSRKSKELSAKQKQLEELEIQKQEMELLIRKVSLGLFIKEQYKNCQDRTVEIINNDKELLNLLNKLKSLKTKLTQLDEEIEHNENFELVEEIISLSKQKYETAIELKPNVFGISIDIKKLTKNMTEFLRVIYGIN